VETKTVRMTRGTLLQRAKTRLTGVVLAKATGTLKVLSVIGKAAQPECFRG